MVIITILFSYIFLAILLLLKKLNQLESIYRIRHQKMLPTFLKYCFKALIDYIRFFGVYKAMDLEANKILNET